MIEEILNRKIISSALKKIEEEKIKNSKFVIVAFNEFYRLLDSEEVNLVKRFLDINPKDYGFKGSFFGIKEVRKNLIPIKDQKYILKNKTVKIEVQYLPRLVYLAYKKLNQQLKEDIERQLLIESGYRSPAYQLYIFLYYLKFHKWNFNKIIKRVALPGYSEHGNSRETALDFITEKGIPTDERPFDFVKTKEYKWLLRNARKFDFYQSYPKNNNLGVIFEPWHWRFEG